MFLETRNCSYNCRAAGKVALNRVGAAEGALAMHKSWKKVKGKIR
jgi:hypothetical protein